MSEDAPLVEVPSAGDVDQRRILANTFYLSIADIGSKLASIVLYVVMARKLGDEKFGVFTFAFSIATLATTFGGFGQATVLTREVSRDRSRVHDYLPNTLGLMTAVTVPALLLASTILSLAGTDRETRTTLELLGVGVTADLLAAACFATLQAYERLGAIPAIQIPQRVLTAVLGVAAVVGGAGVVAVAAVYAGSSMLAFATTLVVVRRLARPRFRLSPRRWVSLMRAAAPVGMAAVFFTVLFRLDMILLGSLQSRADVGEYGAAYRVLEATLFLSWAVTGAFYPVFSRLRRSSEPPLRPVFERSLKLLVSLTLPLAVAAAALGPALVRLLYGAEFQEAGRALVLLAPTIALYPPCYLAGMLLVSQDRQRVITWTYGLAALGNLLLNLLLIPRWSLHGAAVSTSVSQLVVAVVLLVAAQHETGPLRWPTTLATPVLASALAAAVMLVVDGPVLVAGAAGAVVFVGVSIAVERLFFPDELRALVSDVRGPARTRA